MEVGGVIFNSGNCYTYSDPVVSNSDSSFRITVRADKTIAGIYHTHPASAFGDLDGFFSLEDIATAKRLRVPSFICVVGQKKIIQFDPERMRADRPLVELHRLSGKVTAGETVGRCG